MAILGICHGEMAWPQLYTFLISAPQQNIGCTQKRSDKLRLRGLVERLWFAHFEQAPKAHHPHAVGQFKGLFLVVSNHDGGDA